MYRLLLASIATALLAAVAPAGATVIDVSPWLAPNAFGSPSWTQAQQNAVQAMHDGLSSVGSGPAAFNVQTSPVTADQVIVTGFPSWMGKVDPGNVFGPAYSNELGNRMTFALRVDGQGAQFSISQLSFTGASSDAGNGLGFGFSAGSYNYGTGFQGVLKGADGLLWTADDQYVTGGANTQLIDGLIGRGSGNSYDAYCPGCSLPDQQAALNAAALASLYDGPFSFTGTYNLAGVTGSATFDVLASATPLPATLPMFASGLGGLGAFYWRRKRKQAAAS